MRTLITVLVLTCCPLLVAAGEGAAPAPAKPESNASLQVLAGLPFMSPVDALGEGVKLPIAGGKAKLSLPGKDGGVTVFYVQGNVAVVPGDAANAAGAQTTVVPKEGYSQPLTLDLPLADGSTTRVGLAFARGKDQSELLCRNLAACVARVAGHTVYVVDDNCNGKYNDAGQDAIIIDGGRLAAPLGPMAMIGAVPHKVEVAENGRNVTLTPAPAKVGPVGVVPQEVYKTLLIGAVLKGSDGSCFPLPPGTAVFLPVGEYSLAYASLMDAAGRKAVIKGGESKVTVVEGNEAAVIRVGPPKLSLTATIDAKAGNVTLTAGTEGLKCDGGEITYLFNTLDATLRFIDQSSQAQSRNYRQVVGQTTVSMGSKGLSTTFAPGSYGMVWGGHYQAELIWPVGLGPSVTAYADLSLPGR
jgi:hypothetical protein